ncbi:GlsB/YeaQ/YmgE family stress response membrane protein [Thalassovita mediterranea]|jgi:uncharacterized membrane protein YeaQ/YmgE (transglycosylase-associated protein family)|uniref:Transglycosylase associated protein n=1 Tax=Thalassovita mediterranea TaxID=340021 RepID=A0A0P1GKU1_9RHOB|nr:GlsB/YeaQ/YmgE family stress response membrane protein [Thalassovita mediterranea]MCG7573582.1 GlsB/YeaQ/YmgE family stress response membrane protein [Phaeobacter sp. CNT1-3]CUH82873.1 Transglycosylase associated protein [Thalassovita mediterranea]SIS31478.1 Transglycosylase associated protein [Thalassovita mediterranea]
MPVLFLIIVGAAAGLIATRVMRVEASLMATIGIGIAGALIGGLVLRFLLVVSGMAAGLIGAVLGAMLLIWIYQQFRR